MPDASQQRLFVSSVSTLTSSQSEAVVDWVLCWSICMPLSSEVRLRVGSSAAGEAYAVSRWVWEWVRILLMRRLPHQR